MRDLNPFPAEGVPSYHQWYEKPRGLALATLEKRALFRLLSPLGQGPLLEVGCGTGYFTAWFAELGFFVVGLDRSAPMLQFARKRYRDLPFLQGSGEALPFADRSFHVAAFITSLEFMARPAAALREAARVARAAILLGTINRWSPYGLSCRLRKRPPYDRAHFYSFSELKSLLQSCMNRPFTMAWTTAILSSRFGYASSHLPRGGFLAMRVDFPES
jgi:ubiquinone/menaquinone biosynthesis C-methylase UbiE